MATAHAVLAWLAAGGAVAVIVASVALAAGRGRSYVLLDRAILFQAAITALAAVVGVALPLSGARLGDPLHVLYAGVAVGTAIIVRYAARDKAVPDMGRWMSIAGVVVLGAVVRLFMTGR